MKIVSVLLITSIIVTSFAAVSAIKQEEISTRVIWSNPAPYRGSLVSINIFLNSSSFKGLTINGIGLNFDWMNPDTFVGHDLSANPVTIPSLGNYTFLPINILIPENAIIGLHDYYVGIDGLHENSSSLVWDSQIFKVMIQESIENIYEESLTQVTNNITEAKNSEYQSSEALFLLEQAENEYDEAISNANQRKWDDAISALEAASNYLEQAQVEEQNYVEGNITQDELLIIVGVILITIIAFLIILLRFRKRKKNLQ